MVDWAAWGPTIVSIGTALFIAGGMYRRQKDQGDKLLDHDSKIEQIHVRLNEGEVEIAKLQAWRDGYNAATSKHSS